MDIVDVAALLDSHPQGSFLSLCDFNEHSFGVCDITGESPVWEMHPDTDEFFFILEGVFEVTLMTTEGAIQHTAQAGQVFVVPKNIWHKPAAPDGCRFMHFTPGESLHSDADNPLEDTNSR